MNWTETILLDRPLREVRLIAGAPRRDWEDYLQEREREAYERGRREGEKALGEQLIEQRTEMASLRDGVIESLRHAVSQVVHDTEAELIQLALASAQKIVAGLPISVEMIESVVREALKQVEDAADVAVLLHPDDLTMLRQKQADILNGLPETGPLRFVGTEDVSRGGCLVQTRFGMIDARRETKFEQVRQSLAS